MLTCPKVVDTISGYWRSVKLSIRAEQEFERLVF